MPRAGELDQPVDHALLLEGVADPPAMFDRYQIIGVPGPQSRRGVVVADMQQW